MSDAPNNTAPPRRGRSNLTKLINLVLSSKADLFKALDGTLYATVPVGDHRETFDLASLAMKRWLANAYLEVTKKGVGGGALNDALTALAGRAAKGPTYPVYARVAVVSTPVECVYLDLAQPDYRVLAISGTTWGVIPAPADVRFIRAAGMQPLPDPVRDIRSLSEMLATVVNLRADSDDMKLLIAWLVGVLRGVKPYPVLCVGGEHGSSKTYACKLARRLIDPSEADLSSEPRDPRDLMIAARNSHVLGFDNLSNIPPWFSDCLCRLATGAGFRTRTLTTDKDEQIFSSARPVILNGITDVIRRGDLVDRSLALTLDPIPDSERRTERDIDAMFADVQPGILGRLADAVAQALRKPVTQERLPRMADFAMTVESAAPALGWQAGEFLRLYDAQRLNATDALLQDEPVAAGLVSLGASLPEDPESRERYLGRNDR